MLVVSRVRGTAAGHVPCLFLQESRRKKRHLATNRVDQNQIDPIRVSGYATLQYDKKIVPNALIHYGELSHSNMLQS